MEHTEKRRFKSVIPSDLFGMYEKSVVFLTTVFDVIQLKTADFSKVKTHEKTA